MTSEKGSLIMEVEDGQGLGLGKGASDVELKPIEIKKSINQSAEFPNSTRS